MTDRLRIAHCADIHLDASGYGQAMGAEGSAFHRDAFANALAEMRARDPHMMLLAGDLFDSNRATAATIDWAMARLAELPFPVLMIPGNHDCLEAGSIYHRHDFNALGNVRMITAHDGEIVRVPELGVACWGRGMVEHHRLYRPLGGLPPRPAGCRWYLAMGHGLFVPHGGDTERSSPIHAREIDASPCDYIALGHHHAAMELGEERVLAAFAGSPTDRVGRGATYIMVELSQDAPASVRVHTVEKGWE
ncbi:MAG: metallophosphoesterase [Acetobacteraceae bacterium]|nr:metallophosphoesterase [Acetobacteraceae bacterium]